MDRVNLESKTSENTSSFKKMILDALEYEKVSVLDIGIRIALVGATIGTAYGLIELAKHYHIASYFR